MKKLLLAALMIGMGCPAFAQGPTDSDKVPVVSASNTYDWSGLYAGAVAGYGWGSSEHCDGTPGATSTVCDPSFPKFDLSGATGGITVGYNIQRDRWVFGAEADYSVADITGSSFSTARFGCGRGSTCSTEIQAYGTVRGRIGYAFDRVLPYVTAGVAISRLHASIGNATPVASSDTETAVSLTAGGGIEVGLLQRLSLKVGYLYVGAPDDFSYDIRNLCGTPGCFTRDNSFHTVRAGLNFHF